MSDIVTVRIRSPREGNVFSHVCQFTEGTPCDHYDSPSIYLHGNLIPGDLHTLMGIPPPDLFKLVHLGIPHLNCKQVVDLRLKGPYYLIL